MVVEYKYGKTLSEKLKIIKLNNMKIIIIKIIIKKILALNIIYKIFIIIIINPFLMYNLTSNPQ